MAEMNENREEEKAEGAAAADQTPGHESTLTRDPDDASNALARVQQIFERLEDLPENKHQKKESGEDEEKSEAAPVTPEPLKNSGKSAKNSIRPISPGCSKRCRLMSDSRSGIS